MLGHLVNNSRTSFGQQGENNGDEFSSAPASLPSVPSFGTEEWRHFRFNALADASTTSASPSSSYFPGFPSSGSSVGIARSYSTTPRSSTSGEILKNNLPLLLETSLQAQSAESNPKKRTTFILENPTMAKHRKDKAMRACTPCFTRRWECPESETPNRCTHCVGKSSYCKGPIETPRLLDLEWFDATAAALLARHYQSLDSHIESGPLEPMQVDLRLAPPFEKEIRSDRQTHRIQLPGLRNDFQFLLEVPNLDGILDAIIPADNPLCIAPKSGLYDLSSYECLCRRLCACISLLRRLNECTLDMKYKNDYRAVHVVVGFLCQLHRTAFSIFAEIFDHIRGCCFANRDRRGTPALMFVLAEHLGHMHKEIRRLMDVEGTFFDSFPLSGLLHNASQFLDELEYLGRGLCPRAFESTYQSPVLDLPGIHLIPCFEPSLYTNTGHLYHSSQHTSFLDILRDSTLQQYPTGNHLVPNIYSNDTAEPWQTMDVEIQDLLAGHELQNDIGNGQDMTMEDHVPFGVAGWQAEANAMLNPGWTLGLDDFAVTQTEATVGMDRLNSVALDFIPDGQHHEWKQQPTEAQQAGRAYTRGTVPTYADIGSCLLTSQHDVMALSQAQSDTTQRLETMNNAPLPDSMKQHCSLPLPTPADVPKRASKRKLIKTVFSRKKPNLTPSHLSHSKDSRTSTTDSSSKLAIRAESAAKTTTTDGTVSSKQPSNEYTPERSQADWVSAWEHGKIKRTDLDNAGIVRDIRVSDSDRRPMSWPHRSPWRKSLDISVAVLTKGFEKLTTERGESSLSAV